MIGIKILVLFALFEFIEAQGWGRGCRGDQSVTLDRGMMGKNFFVARDPQARKMLNRRFEEWRRDQARQPIRSDNFFIPCDQRAQMLNRRFIEALRSSASNLLQT